LCPSIDPIFLSPSRRSPLHSGGRERELEIVKVKFGNFVKKEIVDKFRLRFLKWDYGQGF
jgi:hypothetical protein